MAVFFTRRFPRKRPLRRWSPTTSKPVTLVNPVMAAGLGTLTLAGQTATLRHNYVLQAGTGGGAAPPFRSVSSTSYASRTNTVVTAPSGIVNNDILIATLLVNKAGGPTTPTPPAGFTQIGFQTSVTDGSTTSDLYVWWKRAASESGSYTFTHAVQTSQGVIACYSGALVSGSPVDANAANYSNTGSVSSVFAVTTTAANDQLVYIAHDNFGTGALTPPTGMTERFDSRIYIADEIQAATGSSGPRFQNMGGSGPWAAYLIAFKPDVVTAAGTLTLAGQTATLKRNYVMPAGLGTITLAGAAPNLIYSGAGSKSMPAGLGVITLAGQTVTLRYAHKLIAGTGTLTLAGQSAALRGVRTAPAGQGTLTPSGQNVTLRYSRKMPAGLGTITLAGQTVNTIYSGSGNKLLPAGLGIIALAGQPVTVRYARRLVADAGTAMLAGQVTTLSTTAPVWTYIGNSFAAASASNNYTLAEPSGTLPGDLMIADFAVRSNVIYTNASWIFPQSDAAGNTTNETTASDTSFQTGYCIRGASAPTMVFARTGGSRALGSIRVYRSSKGSPIFDTSAQVAMTVAGTTVTLTGGLTTAAANELIVTGVAGARAAATTNQFSAMTGATEVTGTSGAANTTIAPQLNTWTERRDAGNTTSPTVSTGLYDVVKGTAGSTGDLTCVAATSALHGMTAMAFKHFIATHRTMPAGIGFLELEGGIAGLNYYAPTRLIAETGVLGLTGCDVTMPITRRPPVIIQETLKFGRPTYINRW